MASDVNGIFIAVLTGLLPSFIWLYFWLRRDRLRPEPFGLITFCFVLGATGVLLAIPAQKFIQELVSNRNTEIVIWAAIEELLKFLPVSFVALKSRFNDEVIDPAMYMISSALGFAALENIAYALQPQHLTDITAGLLNGSLRFFGATLLHAVTSGILGVLIGLSSRYTSWFFSIVGLGLATFLHSIFNFFIMKRSSTDFIKVYGLLWIFAILTVLILEKLRRVPPRSTVTTP